jgi:hypothetical protein
MRREDNAVARVISFNRNDLKNNQFFVIDYSVGRAGQNRIDDVQLVQILLNRVIDMREAEIGLNPGVGYKRMTDPAGRPIAKLLVDGMCGPKTCEAILAFQRLNVNQAIDGTISPVRDRGKDGYVAGGYHQFNTMYLLAIYSQSWITTTLFDITVEPLRSALMKSMLRKIF